MLLAALAAALTPVAAAAGELQVWSVDTLNWQESRPGDSQRTTLEGDMSRGGIITYAFRLPDGAWFPPHTHATAARVFVLKGTLLLGQGGVADHAKVRRIPAGQAVFVPANLVHYEGADGDTVILGVAEGPWTTQFVESGGDHPPVDASSAKDRKMHGRAAP